MNYFGMYLLAKLNDLSDFFNIVGGLCLIASLIVFVACLVVSTDYSEFDKESYEEKTKMFKLKTWFITGVVSIVLATLTPNTKQAAFIWVAPQIIENGAVKDTVKNIPELTKLGTDYLKELLKEKVENVK